MILLWSVLVLGTSAGLTNLALNQKTEQSSTGWEGVSSKAVDGDTNGEYYDESKTPKTVRSVTHTDAEKDPWWKVTLEQLFYVSYIEVTSESNTNYLKKYRLVSPDSHFTGSLPGAPGHARLTVCKQTAAINDSKTIYLSFEMHFFRYITEWIALKSASRELMYI